MVPPLTSMMLILSWMVSNWRCLRSRTAFSASISFTQPLRICWNQSYEKFSYFVIKLPKLRVAKNVAIFAATSSVSFPKLPKKTKQIAQSVANAVKHFLEQTYSRFCSLFTIIFTLHYKNGPSYKISTQNRLLSPMLKFFLHR